MSVVTQPSVSTAVSDGERAALAVGPPRFVIERDADGALMAVWSNPPPSVEPFDALELREIAVALFDMARVIDAERAVRPGDERDPDSGSAHEVTRGEPRAGSRGIH